MKKITLGDNSNNDSTPILKVITTDGSREVRQDFKPHEIRHLFIPKVYQDTKSRAGFLNNRRKEIINATKINLNTNQEIQHESLGILPIYVPPDDVKLEGQDKEVDLDPEEEFQVDESSHGLYLLNYSDTRNVTESHVTNKTLAEPVTKEPNNNTILENDSSFKEISKDNNKTEIKSEDSTIKPKKIELQIINNSTENKPQQSKIENDKEKGNNTLFMSDEIYNHFRPLESELPAEDMAPFIFFGQKLGGSAINDNLTNSPSLSASTKSINFIAAPPDKRKFNSRYSATEKYKNTSIDEEEINEDMDVSVVKNIIEKNKVRNSVKGPAPARHVGLVNAYRKHTPVMISKPSAIVQLNVTETTPFNVSQPILDKGKEILVSRTNGTTNPRNYTRGYLNLKRRPTRVTATTDNVQQTTLNATTEKPSTLVYTAVVTSVSITSSMKGQNKTDSLEKDDDNITVSHDTNLSTNNDTVTRTILINENNMTAATTTTTIPTTTTTSAPSTPRAYRHRIRIRTTTTTQIPNTTESTGSSTPFVYVHKSTDFPSTSELHKTESQSKISERLANLFKQTDPIDVNVPNTTTIRPQNILKRRRRPTTTSTTTTIKPIFSTDSEKLFTISTETLPSLYLTSPKPPTTQSEKNIYNTFVVTSRTSSESSSKPVAIPSNTTSIENNYMNDSQSTIKKTEENNSPDSRNEEVVIEADKSYTASYVLAGLGFLPVAAIIAFVLRTIMNKKTKELDTEYEGYFDDGEIKKESPITPVARPPMPPPTKLDQKWEFPRNKLRLQTLLGQGNFGQVCIIFSFIILI